MSNHHSGAIFESGLQLLLDEVVSLQIDVGGGLVEDKDLGLSDDCSSKAQKLFLTHGEDVVALCN